MGHRVVGVRERVDAETVIDSDAAADISTADTMRARADESRCKLWAVLGANRLLITGLLGIFVFVVLTIVGATSFAAFQSALESGDTMETIVSTLIGAIITGTTLVVTISQLVISQENGPLGEQRERMSNAMDFREYTQELIGRPSPADPSAFLRAIIDASEQRTKELREAVADSDNDQLRAEVDEFTGSITGNSEEVRDELEGASFGSFDVLFAALNYNYTWKVFQTERIAHEHGADLTAEDDPPGPEDDAVDVRPGQGTYQDTVLRVDADRPLAVDHLPLGAVAARRHLDAGVRRGGYVHRHDARPSDLPVGARRCDHRHVASVPVTVIVHRAGCDDREADARDGAADPPGLTALRSKGLPALARGCIRRSGDREPAIAPFGGGSPGRPRLESYRYDPFRHDPDFRPRSSASTGANAPEPQFPHSTGALGITSPSSVTLPACGHPQWVQTSRRLTMPPSRLPASIITRATGRSCD
jgi:hypothetical protein